MSLFVSFTLTPMLCSRFLKVEHGRGGALEVEVGLLPRGRGLVRRGARAGRCGTRVVVVLVSLGADRLGLSAAPIASALEFIPRDDQSEFEVSVITPEGYTLERTDALSSPSSRAGCRSSRA